MNYRYRLPRFLYIDRVVVAPFAVDKGYGKRPCENLISYAQTTGITPITYEFDIEPLNTASQRLHGFFGFAEMDSQVLGGAHKRVSMQTLAVGAQRDADCASAIATSARHMATCAGAIRSQQHKPDTQQQLYSKVRSVLGMHGDLSISCVLNKYWTSRLTTPRACHISSKRMITVTVRSAPY